MKILHVTNNYQPYKGGVVSSIDSFVAAQKKLGHQVLIVTFNFIDSLPFDHVKRIDGFKFKYKSNQMVLPYNLHSKLYTIIIDFKPDIIHLHHPFFICDAALKIAKKLNIATIFTHHTMYHQYLHYVPLVPSYFKHLFLDIILNRFCNQVGHIIAPGKRVAKQLLNKVPEDKITIIPSPLLNVFKKEPYIHVFHKPVRLLSVSRLVPEKNIKFLIEVLADLSIDFEFSLVGSGSQQDELEKYAAHKNVKINFTGALPKEEIAKLYRNHDIFIFASVSETQGLVIAEALAAGRPVVALHASGVEDAIVDGYNGFMVKSQEEFILRIKQLVEDEQLCLMMQQNAVDFAENYDELVLCKKLIDCYKKLASKKFDI